MASDGTFAIVGGHPALDFANTAGWHASDEKLEHLTSYGDWLAWLKRSELASAGTGSLSAEAARHPARAAKALSRILESREVIYRIFSAIAQGKAPQADDLGALHRMQVVSLEAARSRWEKGKVRLSWKDRSADLLTPLYPIILSAAELLASSQVERLRQCDNHPCGWLFLDQSKNGSRRWCSNGDCGNLTRVRRYRARQES